MSSSMTHLPSNCQGLEGTTELTKTSPTGKKSLGAGGRTWELKEKNKSLAKRKSQGSPWDRRLIHTSSRPCHLNMKPIERGEDKFGQFGFRIVSKGGRRGGKKSLDRNFILLDEMEWNWDDWSNVFFVCCPKNVSSDNHVGGGPCPVSGFPSWSLEAGSTDCYLSMW